MKEPALQHLPIDDLLPYARNAKRHPPEQIVQIAASIKEFGFNAPVLVDGEQGIIAGHGRVLAARKLGMATVPCIVLTHLSEAQKRAYIIADNRLGDSDLAPWDWEMLQAEIDSLKEENYDYTLTGFTDESLAAAMESALAGLQPEAPADAGNDTEPQIDRAEELRVKWGVETGQLWWLGEHRLLCGDSTSAADVGRLLGDRRPVLMVTDPPYGVEYDANWRVDVGVSGRSVNSGKVANDDRADWREAWALFPGDVAYVWHAGVFSKTVQQSLEANDFVVRAQIVWNKDLAVFGRGDYHWKHESCWYVVKKGSSGKRTDDRKQSTVWDIPTIHSFKNGHNAEEWGLSGHGTQKPVECMARPMRNHNAPEVYDPFLGSGTTIIAAENLGRRCYAIEISPAYVAVALQRWADHTGKTPVKA